MRIKQISTSNEYDVIELINKFDPNKQAYHCNDGAGGTIDVLVSDAEVIS